MGEFSESIFSQDFAPTEIKPRRSEINTAIAPSATPEQVRKAIFQAFEQSADVAMTFAELLETKGWQSRDREHQADAFAAAKDMIDNHIMHGNWGLGSKKDSEDIIRELQSHLEEKLKREDPIPEGVHTAITEFPDRAELFIKDQGNGFDWKKVADPLAPKNLMRDNGRGIFLAKEAFGPENVRYNEKGNEVTLVAYYNNSKPA